MAKRISQRTISSMTRSYRKRHPRCRICGRPATEVHHIERNRQDNRDSNLESLCKEHHTGASGVHGPMSEVDWAERNHLSKDEKWKERYGRLRRKRDYQQEVQRCSKTNG